MSRDRYWDSCAFFALLKEEKGRVETCGTIASEAEQGKFQVVTAAVTLLEVVRFQKRPVRIAQEDNAKITEFFRSPWIRVVQMDRAVAELARSLVWDFNLQAYDAIHAATAIQQGVSVLETYDGDMIKRLKDSVIFEEAKIAVKYPHIEQTALLTR